MSCVLFKNLLCILLFWYCFIAKYIVLPDVSIDLGDSCLKKKKKSYLDTTYNTVTSTKSLSVKPKSIWETLLVVAISGSYMLYTCIGLFNFYQNEKYCFSIGCIV